MAEQCSLLRAVNRATRDGLAYPFEIRRQLRGRSSSMALRLQLGELDQRGLVRLRVGSMLRAAYSVTDAGRMLLVGGVV